MVSALVLTAAPVEAPPWPVLASELVARLRAASAATVRGRGVARRPDDGAGDRVGRLRAADRAADGADIDVLQRLRALPVLRRDLHDHVVLVERVVDGRDLALAEGVVERVVDLARVDAEPRRRCRGRSTRSVSRPLFCWSELTSVELAARCCSAGQDLRRPGRRVVEVVGLQRVLVLRVALPAADADVLHRLQEQRGARHLRELGRAAARSPDRPRRLRSRQRLQRDEDEAAIGLRRRR